VARRHNISPPLLDLLCAACAAPPPVKQRPLGQTLRRPGQPVTTADAVQQDDLEEVQQRLAGAKGVVIQPPSLPRTREQLMGLVGGAQG
jgi:hypothetical protein